MKKILSLFMSLVIFICSLSVFGTAYADEYVSDDVTPVVVIPGAGSSALYLHPNTNAQSDAVSLDSSFVRTLSKTHFISDTWDILRGKDISPEIWTNKLATIIKPFTALNYDKNGEKTANIGINCYWTDSLGNHPDYLDKRNTAEPAVCKIICNRIGAENVWIYNYDFREDVMKDADQLAEFIDGVKEQSGNDKVTLVGCSLGASVLSSYIDKYRDRNDIARAVFLDGAMQGVSIANLFKGDMTVNLEIVSNYMLLMESDCKGESADFGVIAKAFDLFDDIADNLVGFLYELTDRENRERFYKRVVLPIMGNIPSMWECIPYDDFDECYKYMVSLGWLDDNSGLAKIIKDYHGVQGRLEKNLKELKDDGVEIAIVCGYGLPGIPVTSASKNQSDMLIDTCYASFGAKTAPSGETLKKAASADKIVDSSVCKFEENTWFLRGVQHMEFVYGTDMNAFIGDICTTDVPLNIKSINEKYHYSQFMELQDGAKLLSNIE